LDPVPPALKDRMEVLEIAGYTEEEKLKIAIDHLVDKQVKNHGLTADYITFTPAALSQVIRGYTREAGVRNLEREIGSLCRKVARRRAEGNDTPIEITPDVVVEMLVHVPSGAIPKDGPSAGVTMAAAMASQLTGRPVRGDLAMTGEITLSGRVLPVGGIKEKVLAARRVGIREVVVPKQNEKNI